jgi:hypothetical protein
MISFKILAATSAPLKLRRTNKTRIDMAASILALRGAASALVLLYAASLRAGLIGTVDGNLDGADGPWPDVTTIDLRNMTGVVKDDHVTRCGPRRRRRALRATTVDWSRAASRPTLMARRLLENRAWTHW